MVMESKSINRERGRGRERKGGGPWMVACHMIFGPPIQPGNLFC